MPPIKQITRDFSVSGQIQPDDLSEIACLGFKTVVANRPDGEDTDQPNFSEIEIMAETLGLTTVYIPIPHGQPFEKEASRFRDMLKNLPKPILAYCRSGARSAAIWDMATRS